MKKYAFYIVVLCAYAVLFALSCTKEYENPTPTTTTTSASSTAGTSTAGTTSGTTTSGTTTSGTTTSGTTTSGTTTSGTTTSGTTTSGTTTSGTTTSGTTTSSSTTGSAPCSPADNTYSATNGVVSGAIPTVTSQSISGIYGVYALSGAGAFPALTFAFLGPDPPAAGVYNPVFASPVAGEVQVNLSISVSTIYLTSSTASPQGKVYVDVSGSTLTLTACSIKMAGLGGSADTTTVNAKVIKP